MKLTVTQYLRTDVVALLLLVAFTFIVPVAFGLAMTMDASASDRSHWDLLALAGSGTVGGASLILAAASLATRSMNQAIAKGEFDRTSALSVQSEGKVIKIIPELRSGRRSWPCVVPSTEHAKNLQEGDALTFLRLGGLRSRLPLNQLPLEVWFDPGAIASLIEERDPLMCCLQGPEGARSRSPGQAKRSPGF